MKRMFSRQLTLTVGFMLLALLVLSIAFQLLYYSHTVSDVEKSLSSTADAVGDMAPFYTGSANPLQASLQQGLLLNFTSVATSKDVVLCDAEGYVFACSCGGQLCEHIGYQFPSLSLSPPAGKHHLFSSSLVTELYGNKRLAVAEAAFTRSGERIYVIASENYSNLSDVIGDAIRVNLITILAVIPLALLSVYLLVRRQSKPMRELADAARRLGRGQVNVRVPTGGHNSTEMDELAVAFNNMSQALETSETKRQEFVANVSHELKTPMTTISGYMDGMLDGTITPEEQPRYMRVISDEVKRLSRLVRSMLEVSRLQDSGISEETKHDFDICETLGQVLISFEQKINSRKLDVQTKLPELPTMVHGNPDAITQVVYNLLDNAIKFSPEGGQLSIGVSETTNSKLLVSIANTGPTIAPEELPLVFDRFHKADKSRSVDREGVGLGLYIVKTIICSHEEDIYVSSKDGKTEFSFTLRKAL